ncbi:MAG: ABC transporter substrate-binding protein [Deferribacterales bacterium]|nr:ABC transporter substrate-binding protein [Deferribacterales bacterium]
MKKLLFCLLSIFISVQAFASDYFTVKDMRGKDVKVAKDLKRVATIDDGFIEGVMTHLGVIDKVSAIGSWSMKRDYKYDFATVKGETYTLRGWNTMKYLHPWLNDLACVNSPQGNIINYETLAKSEPQLVILRVGDCTLRGNNKETLEKTINTIEALDIPLAVIYSPSYYGKAELSSIREEMRVIGDIFLQRDKALKLYDYLHSVELMIRERTKGIQDKDKVSVLYIGLNPAARQKGGAGSVHGVNTPESYIIEDIAGAKNAFASDGAGVILSAEQIYSLDPDVIVLPTSNGYHPPRELYESPDHVILQELKAVKNKRVYSMPWSPMNCSRRVEYPIDMLIIAKAAYPERFKDIKIHKFVMDFYKNVYGVDDKIAAGLRNTQLLDWTVEHDF